MDGQAKMRHNAFHGQLHNNWHGS